MRTMGKVTFGIFFFWLFAHSAFAASPTLGAITPSYGTSAPDIAVSFSTVYNDTDGWMNLRDCYFLVATSVSSLTNTSYLYYNQNTNLLYVRNDANTSWLGGYAPGSANTIQNSYVRLNCGATAITGSDSNLTIKWSLSFKPSYSGRQYNTYLRVVDDTSLAAGWSIKGVYTINRSPLVGTISPSSGTGQVNSAKIFTATYTDADADGWQNLQQVYVLINSSTATTNCFYGYYNQNTNKLYLRDDANTSWLGGYAPGSSNIIENSYAKLNCATTSVSGSGNTLTVNWSITFKNTFTGSRNTYLYARDDVNATNGWTQKGTWSIQTSLDTIPPNGSIKINNDSQYTKSTSVTLSLSAQDNTGGSGLSQMQFSNDGVSWSAPVSYVATKTWTLLSGDGTKKVYAKFKDNAGNWSPVYSDTITLDTTPPVIIITSPQNGAVVVDAQVQLQGTIDGVVFSETRNLNLGENILTKTATDQAGNTVSVSLTVYLEQGELIGPEGGEVVSPDGRVRLLIPQGDLPPKKWTQRRVGGSINISS